MTDAGTHLIDFDDYLETLHSDPGHEADILLLTCMDFRFFLTISEKMKGRKYDHVILAGAALGVVQDENEHWGKTFFDHLGLAIMLHRIHTVIVMEHRECGAYGPKGFDLLPDNPDPATERVVHYQQVDKLRHQIGDKYPALRFRSFLLAVPPTTQDCTFDLLE